MKVNAKTMKWTRAPKQYTVTEERVEMVTELHTDLWQRTYYKNLSCYRNQRFRTAARTFEFMFCCFATDSFAVISEFHSDNIYYKNHSPFSKSKIRTAE